MSSHQLVAAALLLALLACTREAKIAGTAVARGDGVVVTAEEFKAKLEEQSPLVQARYGTLERKKEFLENLVRFELLAAEARRLELDKDPEVQATLKKIMVQRLVRRSFEEPAGQTTAEADARRYYDEHLDEFVKDERVRVSHIFLRANRATPDRAARAAEARKLQARFKAEAAKNPLAFANAAREVSDDLATRPSGGDLGFRTKDEIEKTWSRAVADAALALRNVGDESQVVESDQGFHLLRLTGRQPATSRSFDEVKGQLGARVGRDRRAKEFEEYVKGLRQKYKVEIVDSELEKIQVSAATPAASVQVDPPVPAPPAARLP